MPIHNAKASKAIAEAAVLMRSVKEAQERIDELKVIIRECAETVATKRGDDEKVEFESPEGVATVCFPKATPKIQKGANPNDLKAVLPQTVWEELFETKIVLAGEFEDKLTHLSAKNQAAVKKVVEWKTNEPRVTLPK